MSKAQPINSYPDTLFQNLADWSDAWLSSRPDERYIVPTGFQDIAGSTNSDLRSREREAFALGLLAGRLVKSKGNNLRGLPYGWNLTCSDQLAHSKLGLFAYAIGKAIKAGHSTPNLESGLNAIATIACLLLGTHHQDHWYPTVFVFEYVKGAFEAEIGRKLKQEEVRLLSGAVFNTLDSEPHDLARDYAAGRLENWSLFLRLRNGRRIEVNPHNFLDLIANEGFSLLLATESYKSHLYWAHPERGIYTRAMSGAGETFIRALARLDRELLRLGQPSSFQEIAIQRIESDRSQDPLEFLCRLVSSNPELESNWSSVMKSLADAVSESLEFIDEKLKQSVPRKIFVHDDIRENRTEMLTKDIWLEVRKDEVVSLPSKGSIFVFVNGVEKLLVEISERGRFWRFKCISQG